MLVYSRSFWGGSWSRIPLIHALSYPDCGSILRELDARSDILSSSLRIQWNGSFTNHAQHAEAAARVKSFSIPLISTAFSDNDLRASNRSWKIYRYTSPFSLDILIPRHSFHRLLLPCLHNKGQHYTTTLNARQSLAEATTLS